MSEEAAGRSRGLVVRGGDAGARQMSEQGLIN